MGREFNCKKDFRDNWFPRVTVELVECEKIRLNV